VVTSASSKARRVNPKKFFAELKRRNVYKVAIAYGVVAWLLMQVASQIFPFFEIPNWAVRLVVLLLILGFPIALVLAWAFELTPEGIKLTESADREAAKPSRNRAWIYVVILAAALSVGLFFVSRYTASNQVMTSVLPEKSIAVLPFDNQNRDPDTDYLSDGIPESIINSLSQLSQLKVMARSAVFQYKGKEVDPRKVGRDLGVRAVLMGRLIQQGNNLTIRTELVNVSDGTELWGQQYNRKLADVFAVQEEIAKEISEKLRLKLTGAEKQQLAKRPTENLKAFQYYMQGRSVSQTNTREDMLAATRYYEKALEEDRNYALAYAGLANAYAGLGALGYIAPIEGRRKAEEAAHKALVLDENLGEAHAAAGFSDTVFAPYNFSQGDRELRRAIELSPSLAQPHLFLGISLARQGRMDEAFEECLKARELDPLSSIIARNVGSPYYLKRDYARGTDTTSHCYVILDL
jgi:adenylate cyclase